MDNQREICDRFNISIYERIISRRLIEVGLNLRFQRKGPISIGQPMNGNMFFKINRLGLDDRRFVRRSINQKFTLHYVSRVVKYGGGSIIVWLCFSWNGVESNPQN